MISFKGPHFPKDVILFFQLWRPYPGFEAIMNERGVKLIIQCSTAELSTTCPLWLWWLSKKIKSLSKV